MELTDLSPELNKLRNVIISSSLTSCYLILQELASMKDETLVYDKFRKPLSPGILRICDKRGPSPISVLCFV